MDQGLFGFGLLQVGESGQGEADVQLLVVALSKSAQSPILSLLAGVGFAERRLEDAFSQSCHLSTVADPSTGAKPMQNKRFVKVVIWVIVAAMVLSLGVAAISLI